MSCLKLLKDLNTSIDEVNFTVANNMTNLDVKYQLVCIQPKLTYEFYFESLKKAWEKKISAFIDDPEKCSSQMSILLSLYNLADAARNDNGKFFDLTLEEFGLNVAASTIMNYGTNMFELKENAFETIYALANVMSSHCSCQMIDIFQMILKKYVGRYRQKIMGKSKEDVQKILRVDFEYFKEKLKLLNPNEVKQWSNELIGGIALNFAGMYNLDTIESEVKKMIPDDFGSLKVFFVKVISTYYNQLHPIIWTQIFKNITEKLFEELPYTRAEFFSFFSKHLLLNSGPFILKILQMIRPVLSAELAAKYNLTVLTYPQLQPEHIEMIFNKVVVDPDLYEIKYNKSASVGHVCIIQKVGQPDDISVVKIIKPLAIAQSCWEYKTLHNLFPDGSCEHTFIKNNLESNGMELNVENEIKNLIMGHNVYTCDYNAIFNHKINATLTTVKPINGIVKSTCWFALAMTLAPGIAVSDLVEKDQLISDTKYRAKLHRCLDLLVYKFFYTILHEGFYHGDLHAGNIFFSYKEHQMTLIDFGAVGNIKLLSKNEDIAALLEIIIMSIFYNFDGIFDKISALLNKKCVTPKCATATSGGPLQSKGLVPSEREPGCAMSQIDTTVTKYLYTKNILAQHREKNIMNYRADEQRIKDYNAYIFGKKRIENEQSGGASIYAQYEMPQQGRETVVENKNVLPVPTEIVGDSPNITFEGVLQIIIKYYASIGINIAIKFSEFYEFQKAYILLLGVLHKVGYPGYRYSIVVEKALTNWRHVSTIVKNATSMAAIMKIYTREKQLFDASNKKSVSSKEQYDKNKLANANLSKTT